MNTHWFLSLEDACDNLDRWRRHYNEERPHSAIGNIPPIMLANPTGATSPPDPGKEENSRPERSKVGWQCINRWTLVMIEGLPGGRSLSMANMVAAIKVTGQAAPDFARAWEVECALEAARISNAERKWIRPDWISL